MNASSDFQFAGRNLFSILSGRMASHTPHIFEIGAIDHQITQQPSHTLHKWGSPHVLFVISLSIKPKVSKLKLLLKNRSDLVAFQEMNSANGIPSKTSSNSLIDNVFKLVMSLLKNAADEKIALSKSS